MLRFLLSLIILTLIITYLVIPAVKRLKKFGKSEVKRIDEVFNSKEKTNKFIKRNEENE